MADRNSDWLVPCLAIVTVQLAAAPLAGSLSEIRFGAYLGAAFAIALCIVLAGALASANRARRAGPAVTIAAIKDRIPWAAAAAAILVCLQLAVLNLTKHTLPHRVGFFADPYLAAFDHALFGEDPWRITHRWLGWATPTLDLTYACWVPLKALTIAALVFARPSARKSQAVIAYFLCFATGSFAQFLGASAGPIFYEHFGYGPRFAALPLEPWVATARTYLLDDVDLGTKALGGGISAMPSMHVTLAVWIALTWHSFLPRLRPVGWSFAGLVTIGSVHLGWHYAADAFAGIAIALTMWKIAPAIARRFKDIRMPVRFAPSTT